MTKIAQERTEMSYNCLLVRLLLFAKMVGSRAMPATKIAVHSRICNVSVLLNKTCSSYLPQFSCYRAFDFVTQALSVCWDTDAESLWGRKAVVSLRVRRKQTNWLPWRCGEALGSPLPPRQPVPIISSFRNMGTHHHEQQLLEQESPCASTKLLNPRLPGLNWVWKGRQPSLWMKLGWTWCEVEQWTRVAILWPISLSLSSQLALRELGCESGWDHRPNHALIYCRHFLGNRTSSPTSSGTLQESPNEGRQLNHFHRWEKLQLSKWWNTPDKPSHVKLRESQFGLSHCIAIIHWTLHIAQRLEVCSILLLRTMQSRMRTDMHWLVLKKMSVPQWHIGMLIIKDVVLMVVYPLSKITWYSSRSLVHAQCAK